MPPTVDELPVRPGLGQVSKQPHIRRAVRLLRMVHELHKRGYQHLRIMPFIHGNGAWRLYIAPRRMFTTGHGALIRDKLSEGIARYSSADENHFFGWRDAEQDDARNLATKFEYRFHEIAKAGRGRDWAYVGWYVELMGWAEAGHVPYVTAEHMEIPPERQIYMPFYDLEHSHLPVPPPGER